MEEEKNIAEEPVQSKRDMFHNRLKSKYPDGESTWTISKQELRDRAIKWDPDPVETPRQAEAESIPVEDTLTPAEQAEPTPIGKGSLGNIYDQFKGKVKEAFDFLFKKKEGLLKDVWHRDDIGGIGLAWGDAPTDYSGKGLAHIIRKHINVLGDFDSVEEAERIIDDVINNGNLTLNESGRAYIEKDGFRIVIARDENGQWVLSAFDSTRSAKSKKLERDKKKGAAAAQTPGQPANADGAGAVAPNLSTDKGTPNLQENQIPAEEKAGQTDIDYSTMAPADAYDHLLSQAAGDQDVFNIMLDAYASASKKAIKTAEKSVNDARKELDQANKLTPAEGLTGTQLLTEAKRIANQRRDAQANLDKAKQSLAQAKAEAKHWEEIAKTPERRINQLLDAKPTTDNPDRQSYISGKKREESYFGRVELNVSTSKDPESRKHIRKILSDHNFSESESDELLGLLDTIGDEVMRISKLFPEVREWQMVPASRRGEGVEMVPKRSAFVKNGDYELNIDLGTLCVKRESLDAMMKILVDEGSG